jgi:DNA-binding GntR family transcriptional regulator
MEEKVEPHEGEVTTREEAPTVSELIFARLRADIMSFRIPVGTTLQERDLAVAYGVSRTPVREALRKLVHDGIACRKGRFYCVRTFSAKEVSDLYEVREALETMAIRLAIERSMDDEIQEFSGELEKQERCIKDGNAADFNQLDTQFHLHLAAMTRNSYLIRELTSLHDKVMLVRTLELSRPEGLARAIADHRRIVSAVIRRDATVAGAEMRYHIRSIVALYSGVTEPYTVDDQ